MSRATKEEGRLASIAAMPGTVTRITQKTEVCNKTTWEYIRELRKSNRAHVGAWEFDARGKPVAVYFAGPGVDAEKPKYNGYKFVVPVIAEPLPARYDDAFMPRAFFGVQP